MIKNNYLLYLIEFRTRLIRSMCILSLIFFGFFLISDKLYTYLAQPLLAELPHGSTLIATVITSTFMVPTKLAFMLALFVSMPYLLYEIWAFIAPALYIKERRKIISLVISSGLLFYIGMLFSYLLICPLALSFFAHAAPKGVTMMTDIGNYLEFVLSLLTAGGLAFQVPIITFIALEQGWLQFSQLAAIRPYIIVTAFTLGMLLTPPDVISQILLALPMWALFELGIVCSRIYSHRRKTRINTCK